MSKDAPTKKPRSNSYRRRSLRLSRMSIRQPKTHLITLIRIKRCAMTRPKMRLMSWSRTSYLTINNT